MKGIYAPETLVGTQLQIILYEHHNSENYSMNKLHHLQVIPVLLLLLCS
jgi:hypothetical protein